MNTNDNNPNLIQIQQITSPAMQLTLPNNRLTKKVKQTQIQLPPIHKAKKLAIPF
ncbi:13635_t:CDS:1, partial [Gigaspora rosea]